MSEGSQPVAGPRAPTNGGGSRAAASRAAAWADYVPPPSTPVAPNEYAFLGTDLVDLLAQMRVGVGLGLLLVPSMVARRWVGDDGDSAGARVLARAMGGRDLVLGLGALLALRDEVPVRRWVLLAAASDAIDALATLVALPRIPRKSGLLALAAAGGAALAGVALAGRVD